MKKTSSKPLTFTKIRDKFFELSKAEQIKVLRDAYNFSPEMKSFWQGRLSEEVNFGEEFLSKIERLYARALNGGSDIKLAEIKSLVKNAQKSFVSGWGMLEIYKMAYRGIVVWANTYGYFPENYENTACRFLENYLLLVKNFVKERANQDELIKAEKIWLEKTCDNMLTDYLAETFEECVGIMPEFKW
ncbi:MAG: hypothetical protein GY751_23960 [Bacteroidetes bacterium]|nr:hypothetical protein [Bacteroidota bacterium]